MKNINIYKSTLFSFLSFCFLLTSCTGTWISDESDANYDEMFVDMWNDINENYVFFDQKEVDWSTVKTESSTLISNEASKEEMFEVYSEALSALKDGHVSLYSNFNTWNYYDLFLDYDENYNEGVIRRNYLNEINSIGPFVYDIIDDNIGYLRYDSFGDDIEIEDLKYLSQYFKNTNGLLIDVRGNLGGASDNVKMFMSFFLEENTHLGNIWTKNNGDYEEEEFSVSKSVDFDAYEGKVTVLANRKCYSSCNLFVGFMSQLSNVSIIGDTTGGGSGIAIARELPNGWQYRFSAGKITLLNDVEIENGIVPDFFASTSELDASEGRDVILDFAIEKMK